MRKSIIFGRLENRASNTGCNKSAICDVPLSVQGFLKIGRHTKLAQCNIKRSSSPLKCV